MQAEPVLDILRAAPELVVSDATSRDEARSTYRTFGTIDGHQLGGRRWSGRSPWERHLDGEELLMPLEGSYEVTLLTDDGRQCITVGEGSVFIVPRGVWHQLYAATTVTDFGVNSIGEDEISFADDPRLQT